MPLPSSSRVVAIALVFAAAVWLAASPAAAAITLGQDQLGNIFLTTETVKIPVSGGTGTSVSWVVTDYSGAAVKTGSTALSGGAAVIQPNLNRRGWFQLDLTEMNDSAVVSQKTTTFAVITPASVDASSPFGVQTHMAQLVQVHSPAILPIAARAGFVHLRDEHYWDGIETTQGQYSYPSKFTNFMSAAASQGIQPLITLDWSNPLYDYEEGKYTAPHTDHGRLGYANYALNLLNRYGSQLKQVEVWNEYNAGTFVKGPATADKDYYYYRMLRKVHETIKPARPDVKVVAGATVPVSHGFLKDVFAQGAMPYLDVVSVHPYRGFPEGVELEFSELAALIKSHNNNNAKPMWASEFGPSIETAGERKAGAAYVARIVALMRMAGVERMYYYLLQDDDNFPYRGLVQSSTAAGGKYIPNPAFVAYAVCVRELAGWAPSGGRLAGLAPTTYGCKFTKGSSAKHVLWALAPTTVSLATSSNLTVVDLMGEEKVIAPSGGKVVLDLSENALYVAGPVTAVTESANPVLADFIGGFSKTQGQNGWSYGYADLASTAAYSPAADFKPMAWGIWQKDNYRWKGTSTYHFIGHQNVHPSSAWAISRWTSSAAATVTLTGTVSRGPGGDGVGVRIFVGGTEVYNQYVNPDQTVAYTIPGQVIQPGTTIDFAVTRGASTTTNDATAFTARILDQAAPAAEGWISQDVGSVGLPGSSSYDAGADAFTVSGSGSDIWGAADAFHFVRREAKLAGDGSIVARVQSVTNTHASAKAGVMIRESVAANSKYAMMKISPESGASFQSRSATGGNSAATTVTGVLPPRWVKLTRAGDQFTAFYSADGSNWIQVGTAKTITMAAEVEIGLAVSAHNNAALCTAVIDQVAISGGQGAVEAWAAQDIGNVGLAGSSDYDEVADAFTVNGSGADIWGAADAFHFASRVSKLSGDGSIVARVQSVTNTHASAKAGVMIRESLAANSKYAMMKISPESGASFQSRSTTGGNSAATTVTGVLPPRWVKLTRAGDQFTAFHSADGSNWIQVGTAKTITMAAEVEIGLAVTAHTNTALCTAVFSQVAITP